MAGLYYEELTEGRHFIHSMARTVTEADNLLISTLTHNPQPLHLDAEHARASEFGRILVNSIFTFGLMVGVSVGDTTMSTLVANLGFDAVRFPKPVFIGDTLRTESRVVERRDSRSRADAGIVTFEHRSFNQRGEEVASCRRTALMRKRPA